MTEPLPVAPAAAAAAEDVRSRRRLVALAAACVAFAGALTVAALVAISSSWGYRTEAERNAQEAHELRSKVVVLQERLEHVPPPITVAVDGLPLTPGLVAHDGS
jgi:hypothetical protein